MRRIDLSDKHHIAVNGKNMTTFLFWNLHQNNCLDILVRLINNYKVDVVMLAESSLKMTDILLKLNTNGNAAFHDNPGQCDRIAIFSKFPKTWVKPLFETDRMTIRHLKLPNGNDLLLSVVHLQSKLHQSEDSQNFAVTEIAKDIDRMERKIKHKRTLLVGDLNMNPFEHGIVAESGLHATMDRRIAEQGNRKVNAKEFTFFYNPMWSLLGDASEYPPGSYYRRESEQVAYFWHMFDQVLIRPELLPKFENKDLKILETDGHVSLLRNGFPDIKLASDHLPILFRLNC